MSGLPRSGQDPWVCERIAHGDERNARGLAHGDASLGAPLAAISATLHPVIVFGVWGWPEWAGEVPLEEILVIDIAGDPLEAKRFEEAAQMRCDPGIDFGVGLFALGHGRFHLLREISSVAQRLQRDSSASDMVSVPPASLTCNSTRSRQRRVHGISIAANREDARAVRHFAAQVRRAAGADRADLRRTVHGRSMNFGRKGHFEVPIGYPLIMRPLSQLCKCL